MPAVRWTRRMGCPDGRKRLPFLQGHVRLQCQNCRAAVLRAANPGKKLLAEDAEEEEEAEEGGAGGPAAGEATALSRTAALTELPPSPAVRPQPDDDSLVDSIVGTSQGLAAMSPAKLKKYVLRQQNLFEMPQTAVERCVRVWVQQP